MNIPSWIFVVIIIFMIASLLFTLSQIVKIDKENQKLKRKNTNLRYELRASESYGHEWHDRAIQAEQELKYYKNPVEYTQFKRLESYQTQGNSNAE